LVALPTQVATSAVPQLPDNPFYYLASALGAYVDQDPLWAETDVAIISALDSNGGLEVADAASKLCKLAGGSCVLGLPHVLRTVSKEGGVEQAAGADSCIATASCTLNEHLLCAAGAQIMHDVLTNSLPDSVFPSATPFSGKKGGYTVQLLSSVQVGRPQHTGRHLKLQTSHLTCSSYA
jgi:hypothetical protein